MDALAELQEWYACQSDGDWEHSYGIDIGNIDNPGWMFSVDLQNNALEGKPFVPVKENNETTGDWLVCHVADGKFTSNGSALSLTRMIEIFLRWSQTEEESTA